jgi:cell division septal protein FtsQ
MSRRDYSSKKSHAYQTPRKSVRRDKLKREIFKKRLKILGIITFFIGFVVGAFYLIFVTSLFAIKNVVVRDAIGRDEIHQQLTTFVTEILDENLWRIPRIPGRNFFLFSEGELKAQILEHDFTPPIEYVSVTKQWPDTIRIDFKKKVVRFRVVAVEGNDDQNAVKDEDIDKGTIQETQDFLIDGNGFIIEKATFTKDKSAKEEPLPIIFLSTQRLFTKSSVMMNKEVLDSIFFLDTSFHKGLSPNVGFFEVHDDIGDEVTVKMKEGYRVYFSFSYPLQTQVDNLLSTIDKVGQEKQREIKYIDLRIQGRAYACCDLGI